MARHTTGTEEETPRRHGRAALVVIVAACLACGLTWALAAGPLSPGAGASEDAAGDATVEGGDEAPVAEAPEAPIQEAAEAPADDAPAPQEAEPAGVQPSANVTEGEVGSLYAKAPDNLAESDAYAALAEAMDAYAAKGYQMGFYLEDLASGNYVAYNEHATFYSASCIKGPYAIALYQTHVDGGSVSEAAVDGTVQNLIINSDNEAYRSLHRTYGEQFFADWIIDAGYADGDASRMYTHYCAICSAADMAALWRKGYGYLTGGTQAANDLASYFEGRTETAIGQAVGDRYTSWGKAGWYYTADGYGSAPAMNDCGIVFADSGTYLVAFMSDGYGDFESAAQVLAALDGVHDFIA